MKQAIITLILITCYLIAMRAEDYGLAVILAIAITVSYFLQE